MQTFDYSIKEVDKLNIFQKTNKLNIVSLYNSIKNYEKNFYQKNADFSKTNQYEIIEELKNTIVNKSLSTENETKIDIWDINPYKNNRYIVFCEGISGEKSNIILQKTYLKFIKAGWGIIAFDYRGRGKSQGDFTQKSAITDLKTIYDYLKSKDIHSTDIGIIGHSMGSAVAANFCAKHKTAFTILINPFSKASDMAKEIAQKANLPKFVNKIIQKLPSCLIPLQNRFNNEIVIKKIKAPILILHTTEDKVIPVKLARKLYSKALNKGGTTYKELAGNDHEINEEKINCCIEFIKKQVYKMQNK